MPTKTAELVLPARVGDMMAIGVIVAQSKL
jgi:hypothetical protein